MGSQRWYTNKTTAAAATNPNPFRRLGSMLKHLARGVFDQITKPSAITSRMVLPLLPEDVISEILSWVPVKSACRFRCVSTGWNALISGPAFLAVHGSHADPQLLLATSSRRKEANGKSYDLLLMDTDGKVVRVIKSVGALETVCSGPDGPVCVTVDFNLSNGIVAVNLINPATGSVMTMTAELCDRVDFTFNIGCAVPFGTYKLVHLMGNGPHKAWMVLTLKDAATKWRQVPSPSTTLPSLYYRTVTVNGVMHFLSTSLAYEDCIVRLDLKSEEWKASLKGPTGLGGELQKEVLGRRIFTPNDILCLVQMEKDLANNISTNLWLLTDSVKGIWAKAYTLSTTSIDIVWKNVSGPSVQSEDWYGKYIHIVLLCPSIKYALSKLQSDNRFSENQKLMLITCQ
uniref:F-box domain-containing protein n=2 Tax=Aegilops tauschii subsp. strangulata TaxID=200361 RepID=A0A453T2F8_AEGTS